MAVDFHSTTYHRSLLMMDGGLPSIGATAQARLHSPSLPPDGAERPSSALARGVQITDYIETKVNPDPIVLEEAEVLLEEYLSPRKLRLLTGIDNLEEVRYLEMKVDATETSLGNFGSLLPSLTQLKLSNSIITTVRDLGSCLDNVRVLWMARCGLQELDGLSSLGSLKELYLAYNEVYDISPCSMLEHLQILDLEGNNIEDIAQVEFLNVCSKLTSLTLDGNPVCVTPSPDQADPDYNYRQAVKRCIPQLKMLDDEPLTEFSEPRKLASVFDEDWKMINELMQDIPLDTEEDVTGLPASAPGTGIRPTTGYRPGSALRPQTAARRANTPAARPGTAMRPGSALRPGTSVRPGSAGRPGTAGRPSSAEIEDTDDASSELTVGGVVCGNPSKALRTRARQFNSSVRTPPKLFAQFKHVPEHTYDTSAADDDDMQELLQELKQWKEEHKGTLKKIAKARAPQVLVIDHDDAVSVSDSDDESVSSNDSESDKDEDIHYRMMEELKEDKYESLLTSKDHQSLLPQQPPDQQQDAAARAVKLRGRMYKKLTMEEAASLSRNNRLQTDESFEAPDESLYASEQSVKSQSTENIRPAPLVDLSEVDTRPLSGPATDGTRRKYRIQSKVDKDEPKVIDHNKPVIRVATYSPEKLVREGPRAITAKAALAQPPPLRMKRQMPQMPSLPSKPNIPK